MLQRLDEELSKKIVKFCLLSNTATRMPISILSFIPHWDLLRDFRNKMGLKEATRRVDNIHVAHNFRPSATTFATILATTKTTIAAMAEAELRMVRNIMKASNPTAARELAPLVKCHPLNRESVVAHYKHLTLARGAVTTSQNTWHITRIDEDNLFLSKQAFWEQFPDLTSEAAKIKMNGQAVEVYSPQVLARLLLSLAPG